MITRLSHACFYVLDQERAKDFYTDKLGFELRTDITMGTEFDGAGQGFRWLTVGPPDQPDIEFILADPAMGNDESTAEQLRALVAKGALGSGVLETDDVQKTYEELTARGVVFAQEPAERPYGIEALLRDDSGNWFSLVQRTPWRAGMSIRISGAILAVGDQDVMIEFFVRKLGFELTTDAEMWPGARWVDVTPHGAQTRLVLNAAKDFGRDPDQQYPMVFETPDLAAETERMRAAGLEVTDPKTEGWGSFVNVTDPEGRQLIVSQRT